MFDLWGDISFADLGDLVNVVVDLLADRHPARGQVANQLERHIGCVLTAKEMATFHAMQMAFCRRRNYVGFFGLPVINDAGILNRVRGLCNLVHQIIPSSN